MLLSAIPNVELSVPGWFSFYESGLVMVIAELVAIGRGDERWVVLFVSAGYSVTVFIPSIAIVKGTTRKKKIKSCWAEN